MLKQKLVSWRDKSLEKTDRYMDGNRLPGEPPTKLNVVKGVFWFNVSLSLHFMACLFGHDWNS